MVRGFGDAVKIPELWRRIKYTLLMLAIYRLGIHIPIGGVDASALQAFFESKSGTIFDMVLLFSGGRLQKFSIFGLGIMPYITASIILSLMKVVIPAVDKMHKEGEAGQRKINQWTRYLTVVLCILQGAGISVWLAGLNVQSNTPVVPNPNLMYYSMSIVSLVAGTIFIMWIGEQITERGIGNGISLIIYAGIVAGVVPGIGQTANLVESGQMGVFLLFAVVIVMVGAMMGIIFVERGHRRLPVQYAKRIVGRKVYGGQTSHLPLRVNSAGVIPPIFASSLLMILPTVVPMILSAAQKFLPSAAPWIQAAQPYMSPQSIIYNLVYVALIVAFTFFYTAIQFNPQDVAENLKRQNGFIPGKRPGKKTAEYIDYVLTRLTTVGAIYLSAVCVLPVILSQKAGIPFYYGGTSLLIVVGVVLDTAQQMESHMLSRSYDGLTGAGGVRIRGRRA